MVNEGLLAPHRAAAAGCRTPVALPWAATPAILERPAAVAGKSQRRYLRQISASGADTTDRSPSTRGSQGCQC